MTHDASLLYREALSIFHRFFFFVFFVFFFFILHEYLYRPHLHSSKTRISSPLVSTKHCIPQSCQIQTATILTYLATIHLFHPKRLQPQQAGSVFVPLSNKPSGPLRFLRTKLHLRRHLRRHLRLALRRDGVVLLAGRLLGSLPLYSSPRPHHHHHHPSLPLIFSPFFLLLLPC